MRIAYSTTNLTPRWHLTFSLQIGSSSQRIALPTFIRSNEDALEYARGVARDTGLRVRLFKFVWSDEIFDYRRYELTEENGQIVESEVRS